jgi:hypothetical protein
VKTNSIYKIFNKIITDNFQISRKFYPFRYRKPAGHQTGFTKIEPPHGILSSKQQAYRTEKKY